MLCICLVCLFRSVLYAALPPRPDPTLALVGLLVPHIHAITASIRLALTKTLQHPLLATQTSAVTTTSGLSAFAYPRERCAHPRPCRYGSSLLPTDIGCGALERWQVEGRAEDDHIHAQGGAYHRSPN
jgi:hypothetical protein